MGVTTVSLAFENISTWEEFRGKINAIAEEEKLPLIDMSEFDKIKSGKECLDKIIGITKRILDRGFGFYFAERVNLTTKVKENKQLFKEVFEDKVIMSCVNASLQLTETLPAAQEKFLFPHPSDMPDHIRLIIAEMNNVISNFFGIPLDSGSASVLRKNQLDPH